MTTRRQLCTLPIVLVALLAAQEASGQFPRRKASDAEFASIFAFNALIGGTSAAIRAVVGKRDIPKAFALGSFGGAVHGAGKVVASRTGSFPYAGVVISSTGTSIVANSGRGAPLLDEITLPIAFARVRVRPFAESRISFAVNAYDAVIAAQAFSHRALRFDSRTSLLSGALVFETRRQGIAVDDRVAGGMANGSTVIISAFTFDAARTTRHELAHVQQHWFADEVLDRPVEDYLRRTLPLARRLPAWLELGLVTPGLWTLEWWTLGRSGPIRQFSEHEAGILERP